MRPFWIFSRWLMHRRKVVLPEPLGPIKTTVSLGMTVRSMPRSTSVCPKLLYTSSARTIGPEVRISAFIQGSCPDLTMPDLAAGAQDIAAYTAPEAWRHVARFTLTQSTFDPALYPRPNRRHDQVIARNDHKGFQGLEVEVVEVACLRQQFHDANCISE